VKVLDFGLAKLAGDVSSPSSGSASYSPTMTSPVERLHGSPELVTGAGTLLGTAAYMSPEQARGKSVDARADIWAFGAVLFEMLTATRAFAGDDVSETIASILRDEPDWSRLPAGLPPAVRAFLKRSLYKDPEQRVHDIADMRLAIEGAFDVERVAAPVLRSGTRRVWQFAGALFLLLATMVAVVAWLRPPAPDPAVRETRRFPLTLPPSEELPAGVGGLLSVAARRRRGAAPAPGDAGHRARRHVLTRRPMAGLRIR
jgi:eukaryotic-like serine/threonine-protein kinase